MKWILFLLITLFIVGCTKTVDMSNDQTFQEPAPEQPTELADEYTDIQTADDDFKVMEETLNQLP